MSVRRSQDGLGALDGYQIAKYQREVTTMPIVEDILRTHGEINFEKEYGEFGVPYGLELLKAIFPGIKRAKGMSVWMTPVGKVVVTCRRIVRI